MWIKNAKIYRFTEPFSLTGTEMNPMLEAHAFRSCSSIEVMTRGFVPPNGQENGELAYAANGFTLVCLKLEEKIVPGAVVKEQLDAKIAEIKAKGGKVTKKEKESFREEIMHTLVTRAFSKVSKTYGYIDAAEGLLIIDASSDSKAEAFMVALRKALGSLKVEIPKVQDVQLLLTDWVKKNDYPVEFTIGDSGVLVDPKEGGTVRCKRKSFFTGEFETLIAEGCLISELGMSYQEQLSFTLKEDFSIKGIKFLEIIQDQARDVHTETEAGRFDADFTIMTETMRGLIKDLFKTFGET